jgi:NADPH2:quinone reductase
VSEGAIEIDRYGGPEELVWRQVTRAPPGEDEVRIRTAFAAVNRADVEIRRGEWPVMRDDPFPYTPGLEVVGEVESVGANVTSVAPGERVITMMQHLGGIWGERPGGYGEFVVVAADTLATIPEDVDLEQVAALGLVAVTASAGLERLSLADGARVVVHGASGGVGSAAVTIAAAAGAEAIAVLPRAGKDEYVRSLGAAEVVRLDERSLLDALGGRSVDAVLETTGARTFSDSVAVLRRGGRLCLVGALTGPDLTLSAWDLLQDLSLTGWSSENLDGPALRAAIEQIVGHVRDGRLRAPAIERFAMADAAAAHRAMESGDLRGRALLVP